jgi:tRNA-binding protein
MVLATFEDFQKLNIRIGTIIEAKAYPDVRKPAYILKIDFGEDGIEQSSAQITEFYDLSDLLGKMVVAVMNFPVKQISTFMSEVLILGFRMILVAWYCCRLNDRSHLGSVSIDRCLKKRGVYVAR